MPEMVMKGICVFKPRWFLHRRDKNTENECLSPEEERPEGERPNYLFFKFYVIEKKL
jgi:hypothetical protein